MVIFLLFLAHFVFPNVWRLQIKLGLLEAQKAFFFSEVEMFNRVK